MVNKDLKKLFHMGAISAITHYPEFKDYYERKVKEGKHEQSVINAVRSKIALRAVAVVNNKKSMWISKAAAKKILKFSSKNVWWYHSNHSLVRSVHYAPYAFLYLKAFLGFDASFPA